MFDSDQIKIKNKLEKKSEILKVIAHPVRLCLLAKLLMDGSCNVTNLQCCLNAPQSTISQHLAKLKAVGVVQASRNGLEINYTLSDEETKKILEVILND